MSQGPAWDSMDQTLLDRLEHALMAGGISRRGFIRAAAAAGLAGSSLQVLADELDGIHANQTERTKKLKPAYDYIMVGTGSAGSAKAAARASRVPTCTGAVEQKRGAAGRHAC